MNVRDKERLSLIPVLAEKHPTGHIGRTALMKFMYFLQTIRGVRLGYNFSMYSYGPFDADVLSDLSTAESLNLVSSIPVSFSGGYGYRIHAAPGAEEAKRESEGFLAAHREDIDWVVTQFGGLNSAELELASTIVYVDREFTEDGPPEARVHLVGLVNEIKPHFGIGQIERTIDSLVEKQVLSSI